MLYFLNSASLPANLNHTFITLIPKVKNPELVSEFRPISLCNVLYKIFSKVLANRLKKILPLKTKVPLRRVGLFQIIFWWLLSLYIVCRDIQGKIITWP